MDRVRVHTWGPDEAPPIVLLHGITDSGTCWPDAVARWAGTYRVHAVDQRGHGLSPRFAPAELGDIMAILRDDVIEVLGRIGRPAVVLGHSLGGRAAVAAAVAQPDLVRALVLEDPALVRETTPQFIADQQRFLDLFADGVRGEVDRMRRESAWTEAEIIEWAAAKPLTDRGMIASFSFGELGRLEALDDVRVPTLLLADADGALAPPPGSVTNPLVRVEYLDGVGHCIRRDDPAQYHALVDPFLADAVRAT